ncbi:double-strand break repair helicase AddA [Alsobacter metallidurans]|uniref:DNA 3'-5' helicase n=1 Tax=Alsobacter metallidurans TaxID=340221 RepID=A0A917MFS2_9HYPH|nr:double-strand break repair helicase AddA [Alsobacter metallidurans]GGH06106.1 double-strand break repair helicase AddA [Alsobacter metallidurans]
MSEILRVPDTTRTAQLEASDPRASAWVSANAGSGKTYVLSQRIIRLLLEDVKPGKILALTFTKAAAANMANRVFSILAQWVTLDDATLSAEIERLDGKAPPASRLALARRLFARAVETPGGLKIQTIHAFCERVLHLFPFEANVAARFEVLDDASAADLMAQARAHVLTHALGESDADLSRALSLVNEVAGEDGFVSLMGHALALGPLLARYGRGPAGIAKLAEQIGEALGLAPGETLESVESRILAEGFGPAEWPMLCERFLADGKATEAKHAQALARAAEAHGLERLEAYLSVFLTNEHKPRADTSFITKGFCAANPNLADRLKAERSRVHDLLDRRKAVEATERTKALLTLADGVIGHYARQKSLRGALDFNDLIGKTLALFERSDAAWVLYKLDQGIDHVLVDEAQDTSDPQWRILRALTDDFIAGAQASDRIRTLFAVGDPKQSIFSFQGASPEAFERSRRHFASRILALESEDPERWAWRERPLTLSFRSAPDLLRSVDAVFAHAAHYEGLNRGDPVATVHESARAEAPGLVEIWDVETPVVTADPDAWSKPLDEADEKAPSVRLARRIAGLIRRWRTVGDESGRRIPAGDILILVRSRNAFFEAMIRALKDADVPVAGADRLALTSHIGVMDLLALGRACLTPRDDLTLASVLKSPLIGLSEDDLYALAADRPGSLSRALAEAEEPVFVAAQTRMARWNALAASSGPFGFYASVLGPDGGRKAMLSRLGPEAGDAVDEFLRLALEHEQRATPSLALFLHAMESADITVKRDMEGGRDEVRVMTVHGAKGLEAPIVFMADTCSEPHGRHDSPIFGVPYADGPDGALLPVWSPKSACDTAVIRRAREALREAARDEYHRLLYVAMTRARDRLYVCGFEGARKRGDACWYEMIRTTLAPFMEEHPAGEGDAVVLRRQSRPWPVVAASTGMPAPVAAVAPPWLSAKAPAEASRRPPLRPSSAIDAADGEPARVGAGRDRDGRTVGRLVHALLEALPGCPAALRPSAAQRLVDSRGAGLPAERRAGLVAEVLAILDSPALAPLFGPHSRAEAPVAGTLRLGGASHPVSGQIDRLAVLPDGVLVADYKTGAPAPGESVPEPYLAQLAVYRALLAQIYPDRPVRCLLVWTSGPKVVEIPSPELDAALARIKPA